MCGINGFNFPNKELVSAMNNALEHRGPDFAGVYLDDKVTLGHRLLSIREVAEKSRQPFQLSPEWILLFNGQIYNTAQLKKELSNLDQNFIDLDTYILYKTIEKYRWSFCEQVHGMYAIALYNPKENIIRLYRDPSGQKHIYYYFKEGRFIFSSEIKGILEHKNIDKTLDSEPLAIGAGLGYIPGGKTLFKYIKKVEPSSCITFFLKTKKISIDYFKAVAEGYFPDSFEKAFEQLVSEHLQSKEKLALNLSGGLDSSLLLHETAKQKHNVYTYSTRFDGANEKYNRDADLAKKLAKDYGTTHKEVTITKESFKKHFIETLEKIEEPNFNISLPVYSQIAEVEGRHGDNNRVILSGNGGDEIFGGYPHYYQSLRIENFIRFMTPWGFNLLKNWRNHTDYNFNDPDERWLFLRSFYFRPLINKDKVLIPYVKTSMKELEKRYGDKKDGVYKTMLRDRFLWMPGENFIQADKLYMKESIEVRSPLSYHPFRVYADKKLKKGDYVSKESNKVFLRNLYKGKLPDYIIERKDKTGWRAPLLDWYDKDFKDMFLQILSPMKGNKNIIDWNKVISRVENKEVWPGKEIHLYLSLAVLFNKYKI